VDSRDNLKNILSALKVISQQLPVIFPAHPRTRKQIQLFGLDGEFQELHSTPPTQGIYIMEPVGYLDFLRLMERSRFVLTDSGGIQEETTILGIPCITLRENTERPVTMTEGTNVLVGTDREKIVDEGLKCIDGRGKQGKAPELWDGRASERIVKILMEKL
jgi:UDP-N-acetylglucosamine 2-epimerase (non-hydrolysing)